MKASKYFAVALLALTICTEAQAQFTVRPTSSTIADKPLDTMRLSKIDAPTPLNMSTYSEAYERYLRGERFKYRNKMKIRSSLGISQASFDNWATGGTNSFSGRVWANVEHKYTDEIKNFNVISVFEGAYAMVIADGKFTKSEDYFNFNITPSWKFAPRWEISGSFILKSQFTSSFTSDSILASSFFAPANFTLSAGITYAPPKGRFKAFFAPLSGNATVITNAELAAKGGFGVDPGAGSKAELGAFARINFSQPMFKETTLFETKVESFWNYYGTPTLWWESRLSFKLTALFNVSLYVKFIYDETIVTPRVGENNFWQINQTFGFNLTLNFDSKANTVAYDKLGLF